MITYYFPPLICFQVAEEQIVWNGSCNAGLCVSIFWNYNLKDLILNVNTLCSNKKNRLTVSLGVASVGSKGSALTAPRLADRYAVGGSSIFSSCCSSCSVSIWCILLVYFYVFLLLPSFSLPTCVQLLAGLLVLSKKFSFAQPNLGCFSAESLFLSSLFFLHRNYPHATRFPFRSHQGLRCYETTTVATGFWLDKLSLPWQAASVNAQERETIPSNPQLFSDVCYPPYQSRKVRVVVEESAYLFPENA